MTDSNIQLEPMHAQATSRHCAAVRQRTSARASSFPASSGLLLWTYGKGADPAGKNAYP